MLHRQRCQRAGAGLCLLRGRAGPANGRQAHDPGRGPAHRGEHRQVAGHVEAVSTPPSAPERRGSSGQSKMEVD